jgi:hypothetical protein
VKIAFTGASSTGKTTVARHILSTGLLPSITRTLNIDGRSLLRDAGHESIDAMTKQELRAFQILYLHKKDELERNQENYLTERSFVDVASYWLSRDDPSDESGRSQWMLSRCQDFAGRYDVHVFFPWGAVNFEADGYRSELAEGHRRFSEQALILLRKWKVPYFCLTSATPDTRAQEICAWLSSRQR